MPSTQETYRGAFRSHAQSLEDASLFKALRDVEGGRYLDIGAYRPRHDSVSAGFAQRGWHGISVDPLPEMRPLWAEERPTDAFINAAVSNQGGTVILNRRAGTGLSSLEHKSEDRLTVEAVTLASLLERFEADIHWLKIDVEGHEASVIESWGEHPARPWLLCIEGGPATPSYEMALIQKGYEFIRHDGINRLYLHSSQSGRRAALAQPPHILDDILITQWSGLSETPARVQSLSDERDSLKALTESQDRAIKDHLQALEASLRANAQLAAHVDRLETDRRSLAQDREKERAESETIRQDYALAVEAGERAQEQLRAHIARLEASQIEAQNRIEALSAQERQYREQLIADALKIKVWATKARIAAESHDAAMDAVLTQMQADHTDTAAQATEIIELTTERAQHQAHIAHLNVQIDALRGREMHLVEEVSRHAASLSALRQSATWRATAPLRALLNGVATLRVAAKNALRSPRHAKAALINIAVTIWRRDYKILRPLRHYILARPELGRSLSMRPAGWDDERNEVDPYDPDPLATEAKLAAQRAASPISHTPTVIIPPRPRPTLRAPERHIRRLKRRLKAAPRPMGTEPQ